MCERTSTEVFREPEAPRPGRSLPGRAAIAAVRGFIRLYRYTLSVFIGRQCRYLPTCSDYADEAIGRFGLWAGGWMALARLSRCHPWGPSGYDPVPQVAPIGAAWSRPWRYGDWTGRTLRP